MRMTLDVVPAGRVTATVALAQEQLHVAVDAAERAVEAKKPEPRTRRIDKVVTALSA